MWEKYDTNNNGFIEKEEFKAFHEDNKKELKRYLPDLDCDDFETFFKFFDKNGNGKVEKSEMLDVMREAKQPKLDMEGLDTSDPKIKKAISVVKEIWEECDTNKNGYLSKEEFRPVYEKTKASLSNFFIDLDCEDFEAVFKFLDKNGNNRIEKREMLDLIV